MTMVGIVMILYDPDWNDNADDSNKQDAKEASRWTRDCKISISRQCTICTVLYSTRFIRSLKYHACTKQMFARTWNLTQHQANSGQLHVSMLQTSSSRPQQSKYSGDPLSPNWQQRFMSCSPQNSETNKWSCHSNHPS